MSTTGDVPPELPGRGERQVTSNLAIGKTTAGWALMARYGHLIQ